MMGGGMLGVEGLGLCGWVCVVVLHMVRFLYLVCRSPISC